MMCICLGGDTSILGRFYFVRGKKELEIREQILKLISCTYFLKMVEAPQALTYLL